MHTSPKKAAIVLTICLSILAILSILSILSLWNTPNDTSLTADIYQNGSLVMSIPLREEEESYTLTFTAKEGGINIAQIKDGSIAIIRADCPDQVCVSQGFIRTSALPITCLPHRLVIQIRKE